MKTLLVIILAAFFLLGCDSQDPLHVDQTPDSTVVITPVKEPGQPLPYGTFAKETYGQVLYFTIRPDSQFVWEYGNGWIGGQWYPHADYPYTLIYSNGDGCYPGIYDIDLVGGELHVKSFLEDPYCGREKYITGPYAQVADRNYDGGVALKGVAPFWEKRQW